MAQFMLYRPTGNWCYRIVNPATGKVWDNINLGMDADPTYADTAMQLTFDAYLNGYEVAIPAALPAGEYDVLFYNVAYDSAANTDEVAVGKRIKYSLNRVLRVPSEILKDA